MIRIAALGDPHLGIDSAGVLRGHLDHLAERADLLLLTGDLTQCGDPQEARVFADELRDIRVPVVTVLGNHDYHYGSPDMVRVILERAGIRVLEGESIAIHVGDARVAIAGTKGFGGGFAGACGSEFGEPEMKAFIAHTRMLADRLEHVLRSLQGDLRIVLLHYAPIAATLVGEPPEIYPFMGSYLLGEAVDRVGADLILHGHAHRGVEKGVTPGGIPVRNVAQPIIKHAYNLYSFDTKHMPVAITAG